MIKTLPCLWACALLTVLSSAQAGNPKATLTVGGQITPPACNAAFDASSQVNFGDIPHRSLEASGTLLAERRANFDITCAGPTRVAFVVQDNRPDSAITQTEATADGMPWPYQHPGNAPRHAWGLGRIDNIKIGSVVLLLRAHSSLIDGKGPVADATRFLARPLGSIARWPVESADETINLNPTHEYSFGTPTAVVPIKSVSISLAVLALLNKSVTLPSAQEIPIDGSVTFTLRYL